jgi:hypothetical protein
MAEGEKRDRWQLDLKFPDTPGETVDLSEFALGAGPSGNNMWAGAFSGRPELLEDLWSSLELAIQGRSQNRAAKLKGSLRAFWRYLDAREAYLAKHAVSLPRVERLYDISGATFDAFLNDGPDNAWKAASINHGKAIRPLIESSLHEADLPLITTSPIPNKRALPKDTASDDEGLSLIRHLRSKAIAILRRWDQADLLASQGRDLGLFATDPQARRALSVQPTTIADAHATYRGFVDRSGRPNPTAKEFWESIGYSVAKSSQTSWWPKNQSGPVNWVDLEAGLYPTSSDVSIIALLCAARLAWNPSTVLSIDLRKWSIPFDDRNRWVFAPKMRSGGRFQYGISDARKPSGAFQLISRLISRSMPLREALKRDPSLHRASIAAQRSPFVGINLWSGPGKSFFVADREGEKTLNNWLRVCIDEHNRQDGAIKVRHMTCSDFRDVAAAVMFKDSRYSLFVKQLMLGHASQSTTVAYGYRHSSRQESHALVKNVVEDVLEQSKSGVRWDPVMTRAKIEGVVTDQEALDRLRTYRESRTYAGVHCTRPTEPPPRIDPDNPQDGRTLCAQGHLCVARSCPRGVVLRDSLDEICRSVAEYEWRRDRLGAVRWLNSSAEEDLAGLKTALSAWPPVEVSEAIDRWRDRISSGEHLPLMFGGGHAEVQSR